MRIQIRHTTGYEYSTPVLRAVQYLRLTPRSGPSQTVNRWRVTCQGAALSEWIDHFGNICHTLVLTRPRDNLALEVIGDVQTIETNGIIPLGLTALAPEVFLRETSYTASDARLRKFAAGFRASMKEDRVAGLHELMLAVNGEIVYGEGDSDVHTTAAEALADGKGVCQDYAHLAVGLCRQLGVPARYVSGYFFAANDATGAAVVGDSAEVQTHAWFEAAIPGAGWLALDPTNALAVGERHVTIGRGRDYDDVPPIRGVYAGVATASLDAGVEMRLLSNLSPPPGHTPLLQQQIQQQQQ